MSTFRGGRRMFVGAPLSQRRVGIFWFGWFRMGGELSVRAAWVGLKENMWNPNVYYSQTRHNSIGYSKMAQNKINKNLCGNGITRGRWTWEGNL